MTPWEIRTIEFANCNCAYGCPCQFNAYPTYGHCEAVVCNEITEGHYGDVKLDGLRFGGVFQWPKAIHVLHDPPGAGGAIIPIVTSGPPSRAKGCRSRGPPFVTR
jgi:hypothetical protein